MITLKIIQITFIKEFVVRILLTDMLVVKITLIDQLVGKITFGLWYRLPLLMVGGED